MKHFLAGIVAVALGVCGLVVWWRTFGMVMRGVIPFCLIVFGLLAVLSGYRRLSMPAPRSPRVEREQGDFDA
jgi:hypothetical protein